MMWIRRSVVDERIRVNAARAAWIWLGVTQVMLAAVVFYRLLILGQPDSELRDVQAVLAISLFGHIALQLYMGGLFPVLTWKGMLAAYLVLFALIAGGSILAMGMPAPEEWRTTWLPATVGPALVVGLYSLVAWLGERRVERQMEE
jgi:hypothetical protein